MSRHAEDVEKGPSLAIEDGYNLQEACTRFNHKLHIAIFQKILVGQYAEDVFKVWLGLQRSLADAFSRHQVKQVTAVCS